MTKEASLLERVGTAAGGAQVEATPLALVEPAAVVSGLDKNEPLGEDADGAATADFLTASLLAVPLADPAPAEEALAATRPSIEGS